MTENQTNRTPEEEKQARVKRIIGIVVIGVLTVVVFYYMIGGVTELLMADAITEN